MSTPTKPAPVIPDAENVPQALRDRPNWVTWEWQWIPPKKDKTGRWSKVPICPRGGMADTTDPATWAPFPVALTHAEDGHADGGGFVFTNTPYCGIDIDHCRDPKTGDVDPEAQQIVEDLASYTEVSPSGTGLHVILEGRKPGPRCRTGRVEIYDTARFFCVTGKSYDGTPRTVEPRQEALDTLYRRLFEKPAAPPAAVEIAAPAVPADRLARARQRDAKLDRLLSGDTAGYGSASEADLAAAVKLVFWLGRDPGAIESALRGSGLRRDKWDTNRRYLSRTIEAAMKKQTEIRDDRRPAKSREAEPSEKPPADASNETPWPAAPADEAYHGLAGRIVAALAPETEADPAALLVSLLAAFSASVGPQAHCRVGATKHPARLFAALVGTSSKGRKGTSWDHVRHVFDRAEEGWSKRYLTTGLSSGEGIIWEVRDPIVKQEPIREKRGGPVTGYELVTIDPGITDKRRLVIEAEFARTLRVLARENNILSAVLRSAWDSGDLRVLAKSAPAAATSAHINILAHITRDELLQALADNEAGNGFANRFLWLAVRRARLLPDGGCLQEAALAPLVIELRHAIQLARDVGEVRRDDDASELWHQVYPVLSRETPGLLGSLLARAEAQVLRLSLVYALLDCARTIGASHLRAALSLWRYCEASARYVFGGRLGDAVADEVHAAICEEPGITRTGLHARLNNHATAERLGRALESLQAVGLIRVTREVTGGRPGERWFPHTEGLSSLTSLSSQVYPVASSLSRTCPENANEARKAEEPPEQEDSHA